MIQYSTTPKSLHRSAIALSTKTFKDNMEQQFRLLLGDKNRHHMFCAHENDRVVSLVNYYPTTVTCPDFKINVASIGSVCTNPEYRHQGLAYNLLQMAIKQMLIEKTRVVLISGEGGIYAKAGSNEVGNVSAFKLTRNTLSPKERYVTKLFSWTDFDSVIKLYETEPIRFLRSREEFQELISGQTYPDSFADYPFLLIYRHQELVAYVIFQRNFGKRNLLVKEFCGDRDAILDSSSQILHDMKKTSMTFLTDPTDQVFSLLPKSVKIEKTTLHASVKVLDFQGLWDDLGQYLTKRLSIQQLSSVRFSKVENGLYFEANGATQLFTDFELNALVFGDAKMILKVHPKIAEITNLIFPIPFVWVNNLNYQ